MHAHPNIHMYIQIHIHIHTQARTRMHPNARTHTHVPIPTYPPRKIRAGDKSLVMWYSVSSALDKYARKEPMAAETTKMICQTS